MSTKAKKESKREKRNFQEVFQPTIFGKKRRQPFPLPVHRRERRNGFAIKVKSRKVKALLVIGSLLFAMFSGIYFTLLPFNIDVTFKGNKREADVYEEFAFNWEILGSFSQGIILFGDGTNRSYSRIRLAPTLDNRL